MTPTDPDELAAIAALIAGGDDRAALTRLRARLGWPHGKELAAGELARWLELVGKLAARRGARSLAEVTAGAVRDAASPDRLYDLGYGLIEAGVPELAASVLWHCLALVGDSEEVVCELVSALESALAYGDAFEILEAHPALRARSFLCRYLHAFDAAMTGRLDVTRGELSGLASEAPEHEVMRQTIEAIVARADRVAGACPLGARDLRGWHYVLTGSLLLHQSPYGFDSPMHGRFAWLQDSLARIAVGLDRLTALVRAAPVPCVYAPPGRGHEIVARAVARRLDLPLAPWPAVGVPAPGLVVLYDLAELPERELARLVQRRDDQILFAHGSPWTYDSPIAPDVTTLLYQDLVPPWPAEGDIEAIAEALAAAPALEGDELAADDPAQTAALIARVWPPASGVRSRLWGGGPVPSSRFL